MRSVIAVVGAVLSATTAAAAPAPPGTSLTVYSSRPGVARYTRTYHGLRVYGGDVVVRAHGGRSDGLTAPLTLSTKPRVTAASAARTATGRFSGRVTATGRPELFVDASSGAGKLSWETVVSGWRPDGQTPSRLHVITDARTGTVAGAFDEIETVAGTGNSIYSGRVDLRTDFSGGVYRLIDPDGGFTCDMGNRTGGDCTTFTDEDNTWGTGTAGDRASAAVDAHFGAAATAEYFRTVHGRDGIFGDGRGVPSRVHYGDQYANAFWDGEQMTYGDGAGNVRPLVELDVAGHEMTHGVTQNLVPGGLVYAGESGALDEATSDIFGTMVEFGAGAAGNYLIGENIDFRGNGTPLRSMVDPARDGASPGCWSATVKNLDVHYSSGVANHFFFDLAEGTGVTAYGTSPVCGPAPAVRGIGREKAARIWYRALDAYFVSNVSYVNPADPGNTARAYTLAAAADLYGFCGAEYQAVRAAWTAVNVAGADYCSAGSDFSLALSAPTVNIGRTTSATITATTRAVNGPAEPVTFSAAAVPAGVTVSFDPEVITAGEQTTITIRVADAAGRGATRTTITASAGSVSRSAPLSIGVESPPGCAATNGADVPIPDNTTVKSAVEISGCEARPSATSAVEVHIVHSYIGDLVVSLVAPDGTTYLLHNRTGGDADNIDRTYPVNLDGRTAAGTWTLLVRDGSELDTGYLDSWTLSL